MVSAVHDPNESQAPPVSASGSAQRGASGAREPGGTYRRGDKVWRVSESAEGRLKVEVLSEGAWVAGPVNLVGLRLGTGTSELTQAAVDALPE